MRKFILATLTFTLNLIAFQAFSQESVQINFQKPSCGDIDLMLKDVLEKNGYTVSINYAQETVSTADYTLNYNAISRETRDELHKYTLTLIKDGLVIHEVSKTLRPLNGINTPRELCKGLERLFNKDFNAAQFENDNEVKYFNILFQVSKIDDGKYIIIAKGAGIRTLDAVKDAVFAKAKQYLNGFDYYIETGKYNYTAYGGMMTTHHTGNMVVGIIIRNSTENEINELSSIPEEFAVKEYSWEF